ncbi:NUMOD1 domain-containing DNA-binding protein [Winogradskyella vincentii]|uniref:GIY-YIG nuclease family protein n=1 Tax=Winogradskyella vincentii TaxID=2877122 RepID=A0ABS7XZ18_9FLAO|nr:NUMOD1 domain-containing DNA-binding protein [Winogradskyella vincentii]MCA0151723.1 GIY-YIG nuclease family protein [Winogradskyella vincentii]
MKNKGIIYKVTHKESGKTYIGATTKSIEKRKIDHTERTNRGESQPFAKAIATHGSDAFNWVQIDTATTTNELAQKEKEYIIKYDSKDNGYNSDSGGGIKKKVYQYSIEDGKLIGRYDCLQSAANAVNATKQNMSAACLGINKSSRGYFWSYSSSTSLPTNVSDKKKKPVIQLSLDDKVINKYESIAEASKATGVNKCSIAKVCRKERSQAGGFKWVCL